MFGPVSDSEQLIEHKWYTYPESPLGLGKSVCKVGVKPPNSDTSTNCRIKTRQPNLPVHTSGSSLTMRVICWLGAG